MGDIILFIQRAVMQLSQFILYQDFPLHVINNLLKPKHKAPLKVKNLEMSKTARASCSEKKKEKKQIERYKKPNNNPRLLLIQRTKQLVAGHPDRQNKTMRTSPATFKSFRNRRMSSSASRRQSRYDLSFSEQTRMDQYLGETIKKIDISHTEQIGEQAQAMPVRIPRKANHSHLKNHSTVGKTREKIAKRPSTKQQGKRVKKMETFEGNLEPW